MAFTAWAPRGWMRATGCFTMPQLALTIQIVMLTINVVNALIGPTDRADRPSRQIGPTDRRTHRFDSVVADPPVVFSHVEGVTMPVRKDASGRRYVQAEVEVAGTPEEVWRAIATGPGVSSWFVPTQMDADEGGTPGKVVSHFGPDSSMDATATVSEWDPPRRFVAESPGEGPNDPAVATEWSVEARSGGVCLVRVVHSWFASSDDWDNQFEGHEHGWVAFFRILRLYLSAFRGQPCAAFQLMPFTPAPTSDAWATLTRPLGLLNASEGQRVTSPAGAPRLSGIVERTGPPEFPEMLLRLEAPTPGIAHFFAMPLGGSTCVPVRFYLYGDQAAVVAAREEPLWQAWVNEQFQSTSGATTTGTT